MEPVTVKNITIGLGRPKICVPIVGRTKEEIIAGARRIKSSDADLAEWRADFYENHREINSVTEIFKLILEELRNLPVIFTVRSDREGGDSKLGKEEYRQLLTGIIASGLAELIDVELFTGEESVKDLINRAHNEGIKVILSNHDFHCTPEKAELISRFLKMQELEADILKIAVMPNTVRDVLTLLSVADETSVLYARKPIVAISMSQIGIISRLAAEVVGSSITFASVGEESAPGQIPLPQLSQVVDILHKGQLKNNLYLIGFMGTGKTTVSHELAEITGMTEVDTDLLVERGEGMSIAKIFELYGEGYFRDKETTVLCDILKTENQVISCGGGIVLKDENIRYMKSGGITILLTAKPQTILERVGKSESRPILNGNMDVGFIEELMKKRQERYLKASDLVIETDNKSIKEICDEILVKVEYVNK